MFRHYTPSTTAKLKQLIDQDEFSPDIAMLLVTNHADPNIKNKFNQLFLHLMAQYNRFDLVRILVKQFNVDIDSKNNQGKTLLATYIDEMTQKKFLTTLDYKDEIKNARQCIELGADITKVSNILPGVLEELNAPVKKTGQRRTNT